MTLNWNRISLWLVRSKSSKWLLTGQRFSVIPSNYSCKLQFANCCMPNTRIYLGSEGDRIFLFPQWFSCRIHEHDMFVRSIVSAAHGLERSSRTIAGECNFRGRCLLIRPRRLTTRQASMRHDIWKMNRAQTLIIPTPISSGRRGGSHKLTWRFVSFYVPRGCNPNSFR